MKALRRVLALRVPAAFRYLLASYLLFSCLLLCAAGLEASGQAAPALPDVVKPPASINLGSTSFYDGFGRTRPGVTVLQYFRWSHNTEISAAEGTEVPAFVDPRIEAFPALTQVIVATRWHPAGGVAGFSVLLPVVGLESSFAPHSPKTLPSTGFGIGDVAAGATFQSLSILRRVSSGSNSAQAAGKPPGDRPVFAFRTQILVQIPTGKLDPSKSVNPGCGYWAVIPYVAATWLPLARLEASTRLHYQYNLPTSRISNPPPIPHLTYRNGQAGPLTYGNFTTSWRFTKRLYLGQNSYGVYQLSPDKTNGTNVPKARQTQLYTGPGGGYDFSRSDTLNVNVYLKLEAHNTASGPSLQLLYIHRF
jgi:hypothetical protein